MLKAWDGCFEQNQESNICMTSYGLSTMCTSPAVHTKKRKEKRLFEDLIHIYI